ncbi:MAG: hypothetical protein ACTSQP_06790 [Promethearchaeota archaeon]
MPIKFNKKFLKEFSKENLSEILKYRKISLYLSIVGIFLNIYIYFAVTFLGFIYWGPEGYYYNYMTRLEFINQSYYLSWLCIIFASFCILLNVILISTIINPHFTILKNRKVNQISNLDEKIHDFKKLINYRIIGLISLIFVILLELNYYPRNTQLFYPFITCNPDSGICLISGLVFFSYIISMTILLLLIFGFYLSVLLIDYKEISVLNMLLGKKKENLKKLEKKKEKMHYKMLSIEEKRQLKLEKLRKRYEQAKLKKREKIKRKFDELLKKEQFGKKGLKTLKKQEKIPIKEIKKKKKKDEFDFT